MRGLGYLQPDAHVHTGNPGPLEHLNCVHSEPSLPQPTPFYKQVLAALPRVASQVQGLELRTSPGKEESRPKASLTLGHLRFWTRQGGARACPTLPAHPVLSAPNFLPRSVYEGVFVTLSASRLRELRYDTAL